MRLRISVDGFEIEVGSVEEKRHPAALAFAAAAAPYVADWLARKFGIKEWTREAPPPSSSAEQSTVDEDPVHAEAAAADAELRAELGRRAAQNAHQKPTPAAAEV